MFNNQLDHFFSSNFKSILKQIDEEIIPILKFESKIVDSESIFPSETITKMKEKKILSTMIDISENPLVFNIYEQMYLTYLLSKYCASTGMIYAMHQSQLCVLFNEYKLNNQKDFIYILLEKQALIASATSEIGTGGDLSKSIAMICNINDELSLIKKCPVISYAEYADSILVTANDANGIQKFIHIERDSYELELINTWNAMGLRGTCSHAYHLKANFNQENILLLSSNKIIKEIILPYSHILWGSCWYGIASDAFYKTLKYYKKNNFHSDEISKIYNNLLIMEDVLLSNIKIFNSSSHVDFNLNMKLASLKVQLSELCVDICLNCLKIVGISGYIKDSEYSVEKNIRDSLSSIIMINNNRINATNSNFLKVAKI